jgi:hypothetical protein
MLSLRSAAAQPKPTPHQYAQDAAYSDDDRTCKLRRALYEGTMQAVRQLLET